MAKFIKVPGPVTLTDPLSKETGQTIKFEEFVTMSLLSDSRFDGKYENLKAASKIDAQLTEVKGGAMEMKLDTPEWDKLKAIAEAPSAGKYIGFTPLAAVQLIPFIEAIIEASDKSNKE